MKKGMKRIIATCVSATMLFGAVPATAMAKDGEDIQLPFVGAVELEKDAGNVQTQHGTLTYRYKSENKTIETDYTAVDLSITTWTSGWYYCNYNKIFDDRIEVNGDVTLLVGKTTYFNKGIHVGPGSSLKIYAVDDYAYVQIFRDDLEDGQAGIGGNENEVNGAITIYSGSFNIDAGTGAAAIGTGAFEEGVVSTTAPGKIVIDADTYCSLNATGGEDGGAGIGGGRYSNSGEISITGAAVTAAGKGGAAGIGGGLGGSCGKISVAATDRRFTVTSEDGAAGIGNGAGVSPVYSDGETVIEISDKAEMTIRTENGAGGKALLCNADEDATTLSDAAIMIYPDARISKIIDENTTEITRDVLDCALNESVVIEQCSHNHQSVVDLGNGYHAKACPDCRATFDEEEHAKGIPGKCFVCGSGFDALVESRNVVFSGKLNLRYEVKVTEELKNNADAVAKFEQSYTNDAGEEVIVKTTTVPRSRWKDAGDGKVWIDCELSAPEYSDNIVLTIKDSVDGSELFLSNKDSNGTYGMYSNNTSTYTAYNYANNMMNDSSASSEMRKLAEMFDAYGRAAQRRFAHGNVSGSNRFPEEVQNLTVTEEMKETYGVKTSGTKPAGVKGASIRVDFDSDNTLRITFNLDGTRSADQYKFYLNGNEYDAEEVGTNRYAIYKSNIAAPNLSCDYVFAISDGTDTYKVTASVLSYTLFAIEDDSKPEMQLLGKALYCYSQAADAFFGVNTNSTNAKQSGDGNLAGPGDTSY